MIAVSTVEIGIQNDISIFGRAEGPAVFADINHHTYSLTEFRMNAKFRIWDDRIEKSASTRTRMSKSVRASQKVSDCDEDDLSGTSLEDIIVGVAAERTRVGEAFQALAGRLIQAQEEERRRLARELHDGLNQQLAMLTVELGMLARQVPEAESGIRQQLLKLRDRSEGLSNDLHRMTHQLHPAALEHLGLIPALRGHCAEFSRNQGIRVWFQVAPWLAPVPQEAAVCLYRITQEALRNVAKHSRAQEACVEINQEGHEIRLRIEDKGVGFDSTIPMAGKCLGLISIRERVQLLSGSVAIKSAPGKGTSVEVRVPVR